MNKQQEDIPQIFHDYIKSKKDESQVMKLPSLKATVNEKQANSDVALLEYIIMNGYSGKNYWQSNGVNFEEKFAKIKELIKNECEENGVIFVNDLVKSIYIELRDIKDGHLALSYNSKWFIFSEKYKVYFSDITVEEDKGKYYVAKSNLKDISIGKQVSFNKPSNELFETISEDKNRKRFIVGCRSWVSIESMDINIDNKLVSLPLHRCKLSNINIKESSLGKLQEIDGVYVVRSTNFGEWNSRVEKELRTIGENLRNEKIVIWDLCGNEGGNSNCAKAFIQGLNGYVNSGINTAILLSPPVRQAKHIGEDIMIAESEWTFQLSNPSSKENEGLYEGVLYIITNDSVASSGENAINYALNSVKNCCIIGQNTAGIVTFGEIVMYRLPETNINVTVPHKIFLGGPVEGEGFTPELWLDSVNYMEEFVAWVKK